MRIMITVLALSCLSSNTLHAEAQDIVELKVFIHGTVAPAITLWYGLPYVLNDSFPGTSGCEMRVRKRRTKQYLYRDEFMLALGLQEVDPAESIPEQYRLYAAHHIIRAFNMVIPKTAGRSQRYYTFGWSGLLSEEERKRAAEQLHHELSTIAKSLHTEGHTVELELYAHSHGCQVILYLAQINREKKEGALLIDRAILSAAPLYYNTLRHVLTGTFKTLINIYSEGDFVQKLDVFSTPNGLCQRRIADVYMPSPRNAHKDYHSLDVRIEAEYCPYFFGHCAFFTLDRYTAPRSRSRAQYTTYQQLLNELSPLPLVTLYPLIIPALATYAATPAASHQICINIGIYHGKLALALHTTEYLRDMEILPIPDSWYRARDITRTYYAR